MSKVYLREGYNGVAAEEYLILSVSNLGSSGLQDSKAMTLHSDGRIEFLEEEPLYYSDVNQPAFCTTAELIEALYAIRRKRKE